MISTRSPGGVEDSQGNNNAELWKNGQPYPLGIFGEARGINGSGQVVGYGASTLTGTARGFLWTPAVKNGTTGSVKWITPDNGQARGINIQGVVVGQIPAGNVTHAFRWDAAHGLTDLNLGSGYSAASAVNDQGQITGYALGHAFLWTPAYAGAATGTSVDLGPGEGYGLNAKGQVVGVNNYRAILWQNGQTIDLNTQIPASSGWTLSEADAINNTGQIVAFGSNGGYGHALLLTPQP